MVTGASGRCEPGIVSELGRLWDHGEQAEDMGPEAPGERRALADLYADDPDDIFERPDTDDGPEGLLEQRVDIDRPTLPAEKAVRYGLDRTVRDRELVRTEPFDGEPTRDQAVQGDLGDCGVIAALGAVAGHRPETIRDMLSVRDDGGYDVRLHEAVFDSDGVCLPTGQRIHMIVTPELPVLESHPYHAAFADTYRTGTSWAAILEKAIAGIDTTWPSLRQETTGERGYERLGIGTSPYDQAELLTHLTGQPAAAHPVDTTPGSEATLEAWLRDRLDHRAPVIVSTRRGDDEGELPHDLVPSHAYEVVDVNDGRVTLHNPWGRTHPPPMDLRDMLDNISPLIASLHDKESR